MSSRIRRDPSQHDRPIEVLWLIKGFGPGGAEHLLVAAAGARNAQRFHVEAAYLLPWKDALVARLEGHGIPVECYGVRDERDLRWVARLRRRLMARPVDIVHVHSPYAAAMARIAIRSMPSRRRPRVVSTEHNAWDTFKGATRCANAWTARLDAATIAVSNETKLSMTPRQQERCEVLVHGVDVAAISLLRSQRQAVREEFAIASDTLLIGTVANYHPKKDWPNLLRAARRTADIAQAAGLDIQFLSIGQGPLQADIESLHRELGLAGIVHLPGFRADAVRFMAATDVFVLSSKWEGLPVAIMEALALGLPIIATAVGGIAETFTNERDSLLVASSDSEALSDAILRLCMDDNLRDRLAIASAGRAHEFDVVRAQRRIEEIYETVLHT